MYPTSLKSLCGYFLRKPHDRLTQVRHEREVMRQNRVFREQQYADRRQKDYEKALAREYDMCERAREEYRKQTALQLAQHQEILSQKKAEKYRKKYNLCLNIVNDIVDLSTRVGRSFFRDTAD